MGDNSQVEAYKKACKEQMDEAAKVGEVGRVMEIETCRMYLEVKPGSVLKFSNPELKDRKPVFLVLKNVYSHEVGFRIRSTKTEAFKVRPFSGVLQAGTSSDISVHLLDGHFLSGQEKFLIQGMPVGHSKLSSSSFNTLWKSASRSKRMEYKVKCQYEEEIQAAQVIKPVKGSMLESATLLHRRDSFDKIQELEDSIQDLKYWNSILKSAVLFLLVVYLIFIVNLCYSKMK